MLVIQIGGLGVSRNPPMGGVHEAARVHRRITFR